MHARCRPTSPHDAVSAAGADDTWSHAPGNRPAHDACTSELEPSWPWLVSFLPDTTNAVDYISGLIRTMLCGFHRGLDPRIDFDGATVAKPATVVPFLGVMETMLSALHWNLRGCSAYPPTTPKFPVLSVCWRQ